jgi:hypothetical protein
MNSARTWRSFSDGFSPPILVEDKLVDILNIPAPNSAPNSRVQLFALAHSGLELVLDESCSDSSNVPSGHQACGDVVMNVINTLETDSPLPQLLLCHYRADGGPCLRLLNYLSQELSLELDLILQHLARNSPPHPPKYRFPSQRTVLHLWGPVTAITAQMCVTEETPQKSLGELCL